MCRCYSLETLMYITVIFNIERMACVPIFITHVMGRLPKNYAIQLTIQKLLTSILGFWNVLEARGSVIKTDRLLSEET